MEVVIKRDLLKIILPLLIIAGCTKATVEHFQDEKDCNTYLLVKGLKSSSDIINNTARCSLNGSKSDFLEGEKCFELQSCTVYCHLPSW